MFAFHGGIHGYFGSKSNDVMTGPRFGVTLYGSRGMIAIPLTAVPNEPAMIFHSSTWAIEGRTVAWERIEPPPDGRSTARESANSMMVADLLDAIKSNREPMCGARDGRWTIEMVMGVYQSQLRGERVAFPLRDRHHPLA